jgi:hypothetical protein
MFLSQGRRIKCFASVIISTQVSTCFKVGSWNVAVLAFVKLDNIPTFAPQHYIKMCTSIARNPIEVLWRPIKILTFFLRSSRDEQDFNGRAQSGLVHHRSLSLSRRFRFASARFQGFRSGLNVIKHSSLLQTFANYTRKSFYTWGQCYKTLYGRKLRLFKISWSKPF